jgi:hypothetical protein
MNLQVNGFPQFSVYAGFRAKNTIFTHY